MRFKLWPAGFKWSARPIGTRSLSLRIGLVALFCVAVVFVPAASYVRARLEATNADLARDAAVNAADRVSGAVQGGFSSAIDLVSRASDTLLALREAGLQERAAANIILKQALGRDVDQYGAWFAWEPDAFDGKDAAFRNADGSDESGRLLSYWHQNGMEITLDHVRGYTLTADLYRAPARTGRGFLSEPNLLTPIAGEPLLVTSYSQPMTSDASTLGVIGLDMKLATITDVIAAAALPAGARVLVVSSGGIVAAASDVALIGRPLADATPDLAAEFERRRAHADQAAAPQFLPDGRIRFWRTLKIGDADQAWLTMVELPLSAFSRAALRDVVALFAVPFALLLLAAMGMAGAIELLIAGPIKRVTATVQDLQAGLFGIDVPETGRRDEIGDIARAVALLQDRSFEIARLHEHGADREIEHIHTRRRELEGLAEDLSRSVASVAAHVSESAYGLRQRAERVVDSTVEDGGKIQRVAASASFAQLHIGDVATIAQTMMETTDNLNTRFSVAADQVRTAALQSTRSHEAMRELQGNVERINDVAKLIGGVAQQINMISLNATIEAARAGEAGRGFAVVASEVKALARQTAVATDEIRRHLTHVQAASRSALASAVGMNATIADLNDLSQSITSAIAFQDGAKVKIEAHLQSAVSKSTGVSDDLAEVQKSIEQNGGAAHRILEESDALLAEANRLKTDVGALIADIRLVSVADAA